MFNPLCPVISVDSGSYHLGTGTSQDVLSDVMNMSERDARASANEIFKNTQVRLDISRQTRLIV